MFQLASATISMDHRQLCGNRGADKTCAFVRLVTKMTGRFLEQRNNVKFCVKLGNTASHICVMLSEACGEEAMKSQVFFNVINGSNRARMSKN
jgi:hypothetical protein